MMVRLAAAEVGLDATSAHLGDAGILITPARTGTDAFFVAVLRKAAA